ncbi:hypothetical protein GCM10010145_24660 [Streptomyces ruber]|uniref:Uncharacterized protein n=2 Tax=Streptomyces TaxID=1883 RepID=A0A918ESF3_9ACTN|nr:hypothetical protein [Streptomyces ruber]GGQ54229.1 hypothetical protein GCM10010145_24660 [Streptomyces ruber]
MNGLLEIPFTPSLLTQVRLHAGEWAIGAGLPRERREEFVLAVHEVVSRSVLRGGGAGVLRLYEQHGALHCQVTGEAPCHADETGAVRPPGTETAPDGPDLETVQDLSGRLKITATPMGATVVTFTGTPPAE